MNALHCQLILCHYPVLQVKSQYESLLSSSHLPLTPLNRCVPIYGINLSFLFCSY